MKKLLEKLKEHPIFVALSLIVDIKDIIQYLIQLVKYFINFQPNIPMPHIDICSYTF